MQVTAPLPAPVVAPVVAPLVEQPPALVLPAPGLPSQQPLPPAKSMVRLLAPLFLTQANSALPVSPHRRHCLRLDDPLAPSRRRMRARRSSRPCCRGGTFRLCLARFQRSRTAYCGRPWREFGSQGDGRVLSGCERARRAVATTLRLLLFCGHHGWVLGPTVYVPLWLVVAKQQSTSKPKECDGGEKCSRK